MMTSSIRYLIHITILVAACFLLHSGNYNHEYLLDSPYGLTDNPAVRSLENIPDFFKDPSTLTSLRQNWDYRPVLQVTYALNYWISGYDMWSWHLFQIIFHSACVIGLYCFCQRILVILKPAEDRGKQINIAFIAALIFAFHPYTSGVVNYQWARSSLLTSLFLLFSFLVYMREGKDEKRSGPAWIALFLYAFALFIKVEAVAALGVYWLFEVIIQGVIRRGQSKVGNLTVWNKLCGGFLGDVVRSLNTSTLHRLWPFLAVTFVYALIREQVVPDFIAEARHSGDVTPYVYFSTQLTAWWHYVLQWFAPINLISDNLVYPIYSSLFEPEVLLAISGWLLVALFLAGSYLAYPEYMFFAVAALALISPTSSISPLAEMVNEHRPYLPLAIFSLVWISAVVRWCSLQVEMNRLLLFHVIGVIFVVLVALAMLTLERNKVYSTGLNYWADVIQKAPSARAHVNYGLELRWRGDENGAMDQFQKSLGLAPRWHITHINLAVGFERLGNHEKAMQHYTIAVRDEMYGAQALGYRGDYYLRIGKYPEAAADYEQSLDLTTDLYSTYKGIATASAGTGDWKKAAVMTGKLCEIKPLECENEIVAIATPFWTDSSLYGAGVEYFKFVNGLLPDRWWIYKNIASLAKKAGMEGVSNNALEKSLLLKRNSDSF